MKDYEPKVREHTVHSSLRLFSSSSPDFPASDPRIGVVARVGYHSSSSRNMADVLYCSPRVLSLDAGEIVELSSLDATIRAKLLEISEQCRIQGEELILHAERLMAEACKEELVDSIVSEMQTDEKGERPVVKSHVRMQPVDLVPKLAATASIVTAEPKPRSRRPSIDFSSYERE